MCSDHESRIQELEATVEDMADALRVITSEHKAVMQELGQIEAEQDGSFKYVAPRGARTRGPIAGTFTTGDVSGGRQSLDD